MAECIFCEIGKKKIPAKVVYEDDKVLAFLDINPLTVGHTLVIPKTHFENIFDADEEVMKHMTLVAKELAEKMKEVFHVDGVNLVNASGKDAEQSINHLHFHVIPRRENDGIDFNEWWRTKVKKIEENQLQEIANLIRIDRPVGKSEIPEEKVKEKPKKKKSKEDLFWLKRHQEVA